MRSAPTRRTFGSCAYPTNGHAVAPPISIMKLRRFNVTSKPVSCVDGPRLARENFAYRTEVACSHVSGLFTQSGWTAGPDGIREPRPHHSNGIDVPMKRQASLGCVGTTDCAFHASLLSRKLQRQGRGRIKPPGP